MSDVDEVREVLLAKEAELVSSREVLTRPQQDQGSISFGKRIGDGTAMAVDRLSTVTAHDTLGAVLGEVRRALVKLDEGSYGLCDTCGEQILKARLEARPWAVRCLRHS
ncbi:MAG: TraR/DksA family transcriptional regulator [Ornithinimicrobium sp.]|uniref:TraR/DksA family transcriptional regulator n=1 Tax=Ornithinimicrobium sp. TaxID=1977084 RepID=UPI003D9BD016